MKTNQFVRRLKAAGCSLIRHGGGHDIWYSPITGLTERVPRHGSKEVHPGLLKTLERRLLGLYARVISGGESSDGLRC